jgi:16S rRNA (uracil1498-N3)-methyltransferase
VLPDTEPNDIAIPDNSASIILDATGRPLLSVLGSLDKEPTVLLGPEGGIEADELAFLEAHGWRPACLASTTLRFETAGIAAIAVIRAAQLISEE